jgi:hypothetical protein
MDHPNLALPRSSRKSDAVIGLKKLVRDMNRMLSRSRQALFRTTNRSLLPDLWVVKRRT